MANMERISRSICSILKTKCVSTSNKRRKHMDILQKFVITLYDRSSPTTDVDEVRIDLFARKQKSYDAIPPTRAALVQHTKRAAYQAGCIWGQATIRQMEFDSPAEWGWKQQEDNTWHVYWTTLSPIAESCQQLRKCGCKTECSGIDVDKSVIDLAFLVQDCGVANMMIKFCTFQQHHQ